MTIAPSLTERLFGLMAHNPDFVELLGANGIVQAVSSAIKPLSGYDPCDLVGHHYQDILHPDDRDRAEESFSRAVHGTRSDTVKLRYRAIGGAERTILASTQSFLDDPAVHAVVVMTRDVTEQCGLEASLALANARVANLTDELTNAAEKQRKFLAAELHDDVQQILVGVRMSMAPSQRDTTDQVPKALVEGWIQAVQTAIDHLHELTVVLRKSPIDNQGFPSAMRSYVDKLPLAPNQTVLFETDSRIGSLAPNVALACFRIVQEGLGNAIQHSGAKNLLVCLKSSVDRLTVSIRDDGVGFDLKDARAHALDAGSIGLSSMRDRAAWAGGRFDIKSSVGHGTRIRASFPLDARA